MDCRWQARSEIALVWVNEAFYLLANKWNILLYKIHFIVKPNNTENLNCRKQIS